MASVAEDLLAEVAAQLAALYPTIPVKLRKGEPGPDPAEPTAGWVPADAPTALVVSMGEPEDVDDEGGFEEVSVAYHVRIDYVKPSPPGSWADDPDVRQKRQEIRRRLYRKFGAVLADVTAGGRRPYDPAGGRQKITSGWVFVFKTWEARPAND